MDKIIDEIEKYAIINNIPIMQKDGIDFMCKFIKEKSIKRILEIGTAIGYSSIKMASLSKDIFVTTIERDEKRYLIANENIKKARLDNQIDIILGDALNIEIKDKYDLIFIDAAKSQNIKFFNKYSECLDKKGFIITDNMSFHGLVEEKERIKNRNLRQLVNKIKKYIEFLNNNKEYETSFYDVGDRIAVSYKKED